MAVQTVSNSDGFATLEQRSRGSLLAGKVVCMTVSGFLMEWEVSRVGGASRISSITSDLIVTCMR